MWINTTLFFYFKIWEGWSLHDVCRFTTLKQNLRIFSTTLKLLEYANRVRDYYESIYSWVRSLQRKTTTTAIITTGYGHPVTLTASFRVLSRIVPSLSRNPLTNFNLLIIAIQTSISFQVVWYWEATDQTIRWKKWLLSMVDSNWGSTWFQGAGWCVISLGDYLRRSCSEGSILCATEEDQKYRYTWTKDKTLLVVRPGIGNSFQMLQKIGERYGYKSTISRIKRMCELVSFKYKYGKHSMGSHIDVMARIL